jgi:very-short-patch-repair endonuclease
MSSVLVKFDTMHIGNILPLAIIVLVVLGVAAAFLSPGRKAWLSHITAKPLMTANEIEFFQRLQRALPAYQVFPQVSFAAILTDDGKLSSKARWSVRARFDRKIADFVICERGGFKVVALIELDDRTHKANSDRQRDTITNAAGYKTFRFQSKQKPSDADIAALFQHAKAWEAPRQAVHHRA